jgi:hypothetical protein
MGLARKHGLLLSSKTVSMQALGDDEELVVRSGSATFEFVDSVDADAQARDEPGGRAREADAEAITITAAVEDAGAPQGEKDEIRWRSIAKMALS